jgi:flagellin
LQQIDETASNTEHNGIKLLDGSRTTIDLGAEGGAQINLSESTTQSLGISNVSLSSAQGARSAISATDEALRRIGRTRADFGAQESRFARAIELREGAVARNTEAASRIRDLDVARQVIKQTRDEIRLHGSVAVLAQANVRSQTAARLVGP